MIFTARTPCPSCPYRKSAPLKLWHRSEIENLLAHDADEMHGAMCTESEAQVSTATRPGWLDESPPSPHPGAPATERRPGRYALHPGPGGVEHLHPLAGWPPPAAEVEEAAPSTERSPASEPLSERDRGREAGVRSAVGVLGAGEEVHYYG